jgi:hypothetical protein
MKVKEKNFDLLFFLTFLFASLIFVNSVYRCFSVLLNLLAPEFDI